MKEKLNNFYFEKIEDVYFISTDSGEWILLSEREFSSLKNGKLDKKLKSKLTEKNFISGELDLEGYFQKLNSLREFINQPPSLHVVVLTLQCNHFCVYCRAVGSGGHKKSLMSNKIAMKTMDFIMNSPSKNVTVEFQGGEALLNWEVLKKSVAYIKKLNLKAKKDLEISVVSNLSLMDDEKMKFLIDENISLCTSLDGPEKIHNKNRIFMGGSSYALAVKWLKKFQFVVGKQSNRKDSLPSALMTTTRFSLEYPDEIVNEYHSLGLGGIFLRPLSPIAYAKNVWSEIGYSPKDFLNFYEKALDRVLEINRKAEKFIERNAAIKLKKMLLHKDPNFLDLRSPCGAAFGQLAYNWDGSIYTCDEGRMTAAAGDDIFKVGDVFSSSYKDVINSPAAKMCAICSCLENQPSCFRCAFKPYCGICPVHNYETCSTPWGNLGFGGWCEIEKGIFKILIKKMKDKRNAEIFYGWFD